MRTKKQRIISFLMAFLLIFTFAFINPLTISKSYGALPVVALTANGVKIIMGTLASAGIGIVAGQSLQQVDFEKAAESVASVVYRTLDGAQKLALMALSVVDNIVEIPVSLYNAIVSNAKKLFETDTYTSLVDQQISVRYGYIDGVNLPAMSIPFYYSQDTSVSSPSTTYYNYSSTTRAIDMRDAVPFLEYETTGENSLSLEGVKSFFMDFGEEYTPFEYTQNYANEIVVNAETGMALTPDLTNYVEMQYISGSKAYNMTSFGLANGNNNGTLYHTVYMTGSSLAPTMRALVFLKVSEYDLSNLDFKCYFLKFANEMSNGNNMRNFFVVTDIYNHTTGEFEMQVIRRVTPMFAGNYQSATYGINKLLYDNVTTTTPTIYDVTTSIEETPTSVVTNTSATDNVLTLPTTVADTIGLTSSDVNVGTTDVPDNPDVPNTETMDNINTNVGELVTGGTLGEQVNTNIGTVEGLHGELTEQVDFGAVFDTIAQYISSLDISAVTWFPTAVASFLVPFLPVISLGLILFFIDRVLNGGA